MEIFTAQVANYFGLGNVPTRYPDGSWILNQLCCKLGRYGVKITLNKLLSEVSSWKGKQVHTAQLEVCGVRTFSEGKRVTQDICALLSFISMSQVVAFEFSFNDVQNYHSVRGVAMHYRPILDTADSDSVVSFLQKVWGNYQKLKHRRKLYAVLDMMTFFDAPSRPLELKLSQVFIVMENLKGTYAHENQIPFVAGCFRKVSSPPKQNLKNEKCLKFEDLFGEMLQEVKMRRGLKRIIALRNEIIHFGLSRKNDRSMQSYYEKSQDIVREYLLRLLGYRGPFLVYSKASRVHKVLAYR